MGAEAEGQVRVGLAPDVEPVGFGEDVLVAVGRRVEEHQLVAFVQQLPAELDVLGHGAAHVLDRRHPTQQLLDGDREPVRVGRQRRQLVGPFEQGQHAAAQHVARRLVAADQDQERLVHDGLVVEAVAVDLGLAQLGDEVVARVGPAVGDDAELQLAEAEHGLGPRLRLLGRRVERGGAEQVVGPMEQIVVGVGVEPEQLGDHHERQRGGHVPHEVARPGFADAVDDEAAVPRDRALHLGDAPRREPAVDQRAPLVVLGVVHGDHHGQVRAVWPGRAVAAERRRVLLDREHVVVARDPPDPGRLVVVDGCLPAHPGPDLVGIVGVPVPVEQVEPRADRVRRGHGRGSPQRRWAMMLRCTSLVPP